MSSTVGYRQYIRKKIKKNISDSYTTALHNALLSLKEEIVKTFCYLLLSCLSLSHATIAVFVCVMCHISLLTADYYLCHFQPNDLSAEIHNIVLIE